MNQSQNLLKSVLKRNNYELDYISQEKLVLKQSEKEPPIIKKYYTIALILVIVGIIAVFFISTIFGIIMLSSSVPIYIRAKKLKKRDKHNIGRTISINKNKIEIEQVSNTEIFKIPTDNILKFSYKFDRDENLSSGKIIIETNNKEKIDVIEFFGQEKNYIEEDLKKVVKEINKILNSKASST